ncbi:hypothetical protein [uncultured Maribacter sp.]|uniref:hypothetical protein n=1 Tax=uncultured Maribacter sp. TaxID=431308 RepID=UPI00260C1901|nr:hypothetical protein [uncultured Maribacter sp.]
MNDYIKGDYTVAANENSYGDKEDLTADTRTFLYVEEILSAIKYDYVIFGRTPARGYESPTFGREIDKDLKRNKMERFSSEVSILNIFNWTGLIGVVLYFLIFVRASYLALKKSNNWALKCLGIYVAFRWMYAWVEDYSSFDLSFLFLFLAISICYSKAFRDMTDSEFKYWLFGVFDKRYHKAVKKLQLVEIEDI